MSPIEPKKKYWRNIDTKDVPESQNTFFTREFQEGMTELKDGVSRRDFIKLMGASAALAGVAGCSSVRLPKQEIKPYAKMPESVIPGQSLHYATVMTQGERVTGVLVETHEGRPTKIEGNESHPMSLGATGIYEQASVLDLYDPDRVKETQLSGTVSEDFEAWVASARKRFGASSGSGLALLVETQLSPSYVRALDLFQSKFPKAAIYRYDSVNRDSLISGLRQATGRSVVPHYHFSLADVIVSFGGDFLGNDPLQVPYSRAFADRRDPELGALNRLYVIENQYTLTGAKADHRFRSKTQDIAANVIGLAFALLPKLGLGSSLAQALDGVATPRTSLTAQELSIIADDLIRNSGKSIVLAGNSQPEVVHHLVYLMNEALRNNGTAVTYYQVPFADRSFYARSSQSSIVSLVKSMKSGAVDTLVVLGGDPVYNAPSDLKFLEALKFVKTTVHLTSHTVATTRHAHWVLGRSHYLESWGDAQALDGTLSVCQPVIQPLYRTKSDLELLLLLSGSSDSAYSFVRETLRSGYNLGDSSWEPLLNSGASKGNSTVSTTAASTSISGALNALLSRLKANKGFELVFAQSYSLYDGRFSNNGWLQELPDPISKLTWDNPLMISPGTARDLSLASGDMVKLMGSNIQLEMPVFVSPGHADRSLTAFLGYGQSSIGRVGESVGFDVQPARRSTAMTLVTGITLLKLNRKYDLATTQEHGSMEGRPHYREGSVDEYASNPTFASEMVETMPLKSLFDERPYDTGYQWGMSIDLARCTGCNACMVGCQSENNIPIVGKKEVLIGRDMSWIRIDRYFEGDPENPDVVEQPVTCLQCENAPCEQVCPVAATVHSTEGLNDMVYNRCIGTRYCADNCPVKVRRFNFFDFHQKNPQSRPKKRYHIFDLMKEPETTVQMQFNPDVTVRMRGIMEKCTYCVQRINHARHVSDNEKRSIRDGEIQTACQQACPAEAIVFGNILDASSKVAKLKSRNRNYHILEQLHLKARTSYLASIRNPNPRLEKKEKVTHHA